MSAAKMAAIFPVSDMSAPGGQEDFVQFLQMRVRHSREYPHTRDVRFFAHSRRPASTRTAAVHYGVLSAENSPVAIGRNPNALIQIRDRLAARADALARPGPLVGLSESPPWRGLAPRTDGIDAAGILRRSPEAQRRCRMPKPIASAFCLMAPSVLFSAFATLETGVLAFECALRSRTSSLVQGLR
jgi:hypothetical protein